MPEKPSNYNAMPPEQQKGWIKGQQQIKEKQEKFDLYFMNDERAYIIGLLRELVKTLSVAEYETAIPLDDVKRKAQGLASALIHELQYVYETIPANNNPALAAVALIEQFIEDLNRLQY